MYNLRLEHELHFSWDVEKYFKFPLSWKNFHGFSFSIFSFFCQFEVFWKLPLNVTPSIGVSPLQLSHKYRPIPSKATAINTDECSKGIFQTLKFGKAVKLFFLQSIVRRIICQCLYMRLALNLRGKRWFTPA